MGLNTAALQDLLRSRQWFQVDGNGWMHADLVGEPGLDEGLSVLDAYAYETRPRPPHLTDEQLHRLVEMIRKA